MRKIKLEVDRLQVETFEVGPVGTAGRGTVEAHRVRAVTYGTCWQSCSPEDTCPEGCTNTCQVNWSCGGDESCDGNCTSGGGTTTTGPDNTNV